MRLFIAIELPRKQQESLFKLGEQLNHVKRVPLKQLHLTLKFLGEQGKHEVQAIKDLLRSISFHPFQLGIHTVGSFDHKGQTRVIWAGLRPSKQLSALHTAINGALNVHISPNPGTFHPHITLARPHTIFHPQMAEKFLKQNRELILDPFDVDHFTLFESQLSKTGAKHIPVHRYPLTPG